MATDPGKPDHGMLPCDDPARSDDVVQKSIDSPEYQRLCRLLRRLRERAGLTQAQLAERIAEGQWFVSSYETGQRRLDVVELRAILAAIGGHGDLVVAQFDVMLATMAALAGETDR